MQKMGTKEGYNDKWHMEVPNSDEPFFNVEEGLKISLSTVYIMLQNRSHIGQKYYARLWHTRGIMKQVQYGGLKQG